MATQFPPIDPAAIGRAMRDSRAYAPTRRQRLASDAVFAREAVKLDNTRRFHMAKHDPKAVWLRNGVSLDDRKRQNTLRSRVANDRLDGPAVHQRIDGPDYLAWFAVAFAIGCVLYFAGQMLRAVM